MKSAVPIPWSGFDCRRRESARLAILLLTIVASLPLAAQPTPNHPTFTSALAGVPFNAMAVDSLGNTYVTGSGASNVIPVTPGAFQTTYPQSVCGAMFPTPCFSAYVIKLDSSGAIVYATYLNGSCGSATYGIAVDAEGNAYITGTTSSSDFPVTTGAAFTAAQFNGCYQDNGFIAKLNPTGSALVYGTFVPGMTPLALAIDGAGNAYATGYSSPSFPTTAGAFQTAPKNSGAQDSGAAVKLNAPGSALVYATFLSGSGTISGGDEPNAIAVDASGDAAIAGFSASSDFPVTPGAFQSTAPAAVSAFVSKLNPTGTGLIFSTYLGGSNKRTMSVRFESQGGLYVLGETPGAFPVTPGAYYPTPSGVLLAHLSAAGTLAYATYLPLQPAGYGEALDLDSAGNLLVAGATSIPSLPSGPAAFQSALAGSYNAYVMKFTPSFELLGATYLGGSASDDAYLIAAAPNGSVAIAGYTTSPDFPGASPPPASYPGDWFVTSLFPAITVQNAAGFTANAVAPGEIVAIRGYGIGPATGAIAQPAPDGALPTSLAGVSVEFAGFDAPLFYAQGQQINAQVPWETAGNNSVALQIQYQTRAISQTFGPLPVPAASSVPGIFYVNDSEGAMNSAAHPAKPGDFITLYGTGGGLTNPLGVTGAIWPETAALPLLALPVSITIGGESATVLYAGASPLNSSGVFQINVLLPADLPAAATSLVLKIGDSTNAVTTFTVAIQ